MTNEMSSLRYSGIFFDSANLIELKSWFDTKILGGVTTNPVILQKDGIYDISGHVRKMIDIVGEGFPISIEIPDSKWDKDKMIRVAMDYQNKFPNNTVIKVPMDPRDPQKAFEVIYKLGQEGIRVNATLGISMGQLVGASEALRLTNAKGDNYISLFWGRKEEAKKQIVQKMVDDELKRYPLKIFKKNQLKNEFSDIVPDAATTLAMTLNYLKNHSSAARVIIGSVRTPDQIEKAFEVGADIVTIPPKLLSDWMYTKRGEETAIQFNKAYNDAEDKIKL